jgi:hypothetical protein
MLHVDLMCVISKGKFQISGKPAVPKRALYEIPALLHQNLCKDKSPSVSGSVESKITNH